MSRANPMYRRQTATTDEIRGHLEACSARHQPPLAPRVDLGAYALKIAGNAATFEAWADGELVGLVAAYIDDVAARTGYVTNVSVTQEFAGRGIASRLMAMCVDAAAAAGMKLMKLEVGGANRPAIELYRKLGFEESARKEDFIVMQRFLEGHRPTP